MYLFVFMTLTHREDSVIPSIHFSDNFTVIFSFIQPSVERKIYQWFSSFLFTQSIGTYVPESELMESGDVEKMYGHRVNEERRVMKSAESWRAPSHEGRSVQMERRKSFNDSRSVREEEEQSICWRADAFFNPQVSQSVAMNCQCHGFYSHWTNSFILSFGYQLQSKLQSVI